MDILVSIVSVVPIVPVVHVACVVQGCIKFTPANIVISGFLFSKLSAPCPLLPASSFVPE
jgi:hypothetical protein